MCKKHDAYKLGLIYWLEHWVQPYEYDRYIIVYGCYQRAVALIINARKIVEINRIYVTLLLETFFIIDKGSYTNPEYI